MLALLGIGSAHLFVPHDLRRGHAQDLVECGHNLTEILQAGDWRSAAFKNYLDEEYVEAAAVAAGRLCESSEEEET